MIKLRANRIYFSLIMGVIVITLSCNSSATKQNPPVSEKRTEEYSELKLNPSEYVQWFKSSENHLRKTIHSNEMHYTLEYCSPEFVAIQLLQKNEITQAELDTALKETEGLLQFKLKIEDTGSGREFLKNGTPSDEEYEKRVKYFAFEMQRDIYLLNDTGDSIPCAMYHFERSYNVSPASVFLLGFAGAGQENKMELIVNERIFANRELRFVFTADELKNIPQLKTL